MSGILWASLMGLGTLLGALLGWRWGRRRASSPTIVTSTTPYHAPLPASPSPPRPRLSPVAELPEDVARRFASVVNAINNRLSVIRNRASLIRLDRLSTEERTWIQSILVESDKCGELTGSLLQLVSPAAHAGRPGQVGGSPASPVPGLHVLVVDDDLGVRLTVGTVLEGAGYHVTVVENGVEAFRILDRGGVDAIVTDLRMPALSGRGFFEQLEEGYPALAGRVVFITGDYSRPESRDFLAQTGQPLIPKPFRSQDLVQAVARVTFGYSPPAS